MATHYVSLIGPLVGIMYPLPDDLGTERQRRTAVHTSRLGKLWHSIYTRDEVLEQQQRFPLTILPDEFARKLDYDSLEVARQAV